MKPSRVLTAVLLATSLPWVVGCQSVTGLDDLVIGDAGAPSASSTGGGTSSSSTATGGGGTATGAGADGGGGSTSSAGGSGGAMVPPPCSPTSIDSFQDAFDDGQIRPGWEISDASNVEIIESGGELVFKLTTQMTEQLSFVTSAGTYDFTDCQATVRVTEVPIGLGFGGLMVRGPAFEQRVELTYQAGKLLFSTWDGPTSEDQTPFGEVTYVPGEHEWWRLALSGDEVLFQTSDGGDFVTHAQAPLPWASPSESRIILHGATSPDGPNPASAGYVKFDDLNLKPER